MLFYFFGAQVTVKIQTRIDPSLVWTKKNQFDFKHDYVFTIESIDCR